MLDAITQYWPEITAISIGGVSLVTIIGIIIWLVNFIKTVKQMFEQDKNVTTTTIENAFKNAVLPSKIKLDVSEKIEKPIKQGISEMSDTLKEYLTGIHKENVLILKILSQFTHTKKLTEEEQEQIAEIVGNETIEEVKL